MTSPPLWILLLVVLLGLGLVVALPFYAFLVVDLFLGAVLAGEWTAGGVIFDFTDILLLALLVALVVRGRLSLRALQEIPYFKLWLGMGLFLTISFLFTPSWIRGEAVPRDFSAPLEIVYQLYRYEWKTILYFPLTFVLLGGYLRFPVAIFALLLAGDTLAVATISENMLGFQATWIPFTAGNAVGGVLLVPLVLAASGLIYYRSRGQLVLSAVSFLLIARALAYTGSRGAMAATILGMLTVLLLALSKAASRRRAFRLIPAAIALVVLAFIVQPDLLNRPYMQRTLTLTQPMQQRTLVWRMESRWPHFLDKAMEHPLVGTGSDVDRSLSTGEGVGNTPHNSYLSLALIFGIPTTLCWLAFALLAIRSGLRSHAKASSWEERQYGLVVVAGLLALLLHATVDRSLLLPFIQKVFWLLTATGCALRRVGVAVESDVRRPETIAPIAQPALPG